MSFYYKTAMQMQSGCRRDWQQGNKPDRALEVRPGHACAQIHVTTSVFTKRLGKMATFVMTKRDAVKFVHFHANHLRSQLSNLAPELDKLVRGSIESFQMVHCQPN